MATFVDADPQDGLAEVTGHTEQMRASGCYQAAGERMSCLSCHDPHFKPAAEDRVGYFRKRCLNCHEQNGCSAPDDVRGATTPADNCLSCHMPAVASQVQHAAITDHRVPRRPGEPTKRPANRSLLPLAPFAPQQFHGSREEARRDMAVALMQLAAQQPERVRPQQVQMVMADLVGAVERDHRDFDAADALAQALFQAGESNESIRILGRALEAEPKQEMLLGNAAFTAMQIGRIDLATRFLEQAAEVSPSQIRYPMQQIQIALRGNRWRQAERASRRALELDPSNFSASQGLVLSLSYQGETEQAEAELSRMQRSYPDQEQALQSWFGKVQGDIRRGD